MHRLIHFRLCPFSRAVRLVLSETKLEVQLVDDRPWEPSQELLALNPSGELPVLQVADGATVCGSYAISEFIAEELALRPRNGEPVEASNAPLFPGDRQDRAETRRLIDWFHRKFDAEVTAPMLEAKVYSRFRNRQGPGPDAELLRQVRRSLKYHLSYIDYLTDQRSWLAGEELSFADLTAAGHISVADYLGEVDWVEGSPSKTWYAKLKSRLSLRMMLAERIPGTQVPPNHYANPDF